MVETWYALLAFAFVGFAVTEGRNFGIGAVLYLVGKTREERRAVTRAVGPLWSWHEVWLIAAGLTLFMAFPKVLAAALSGYYLAIFVLLWCGVLRGIALEFGPHQDDAMWQAFWDAVFTLGSGLLGLFFGVAFGNLLRGVPLGARGTMFLPFFTNFRATGQVGILDWYTLTVAGFTLSLLGAHASTYLAEQAEGLVRERSLRLAKRLWIVTLVLLPVVTIATHAVRPGFLAGLRSHPVAWLGVVALLAGIAGVLAGLWTGKESMARQASGLCIAGLLAGAAAAIFPVMLRSTLGDNFSLTAHDGAAGPYSLRSGLYWWPLAMLLSLGYAWWVTNRGMVQGTRGKPGQGTREKSDQGTRGTVA